MTKNEALSPYPECANYKETDKKPGPTSHGTQLPDLFEVVWSG